jgi:outer membrane protein assembly factor BamB
MCAYDFKGELVWQRDLGKYQSQHGPGHSPIVYQGKVIYANDQDGSAELLALDARTGKTVWQVERKPFRACYSAPMVLEKTGSAPELLVASTAGITSYEPATGKENWKYVWTFTRMPLRTVASPVVGDGVVVATSGDGAGDRHVIAVRLGGKGDVTETHLAWEDRKACTYVPTMLAVGEHLYSVNDAGLARCQVARTGEEVWSHRLGSPVTASPILIDGKVYAAGEDGSIYVYQASTTFKLLAKNSVGEPISATPAVAENRLFVRGLEHLFCIGNASTK